MKPIHLIFSWHMPWQLSDFHFSQVNEKPSFPLFFDEKKTRSAFRDQAEKTVLPLLFHLEELIRRNRHFKLGFALSGTVLQQIKEFEPLVFSAFQKINRTRRVEWLACPDNHSLSGIYAPNDYLQELKRHQNAIKEAFGQQPKIVLNPYLFLNNPTAQCLSQVGFLGVISNGENHMLDGRSPNHLFMSRGYQNLPVLLTNPKLVKGFLAFEDHSDVEKTENLFHAFLQEVGRSEVINLHIDLNRWKGKSMEQVSQGLASLFLMISYVHEKRMAQFGFPCESVGKLKPKGVLDIHDALAEVECNDNLQSLAGSSLRTDILKSAYKLLRKMPEGHETEKALLQTLLDSEYLRNISDSTQPQARYDDFIKLKLMLDSIQKAVFPKKFSFNARFEMNVAEG